MDALTSIKWKINLAKITVYLLLTELVNFVLINWKFLNSPQTFYYEPRFWRHLQIQILCSHHLHTQLVLHDPGTPILLPCLSSHLYRSIDLLSSQNDRAYRWWSCLSLQTQLNPEYQSSAKEGLNLNDSLARNLSCYYHPQLQRRSLAAWSNTKDVRKPWNRQNWLLSLFSNGRAWKGSTRKSSWNYKEKQVALQTHGLLASFHSIGLSKG